MRGGRALAGASNLLGYKELKCLARGKVTRHDTWPLTSADRAQSVKTGRGIQVTLRMTVWHRQLQNTNTILVAIKLSITILNTRLTDY